MIGKKGTIVFSAKTARVGQLKKEVERALKNDL
jgi:hypothetical protein